MVDDAVGGKVTDARTLAIKGLNNTLPDDGITEASQYRANLVEGIAGFSAGFTTTLVSHPLDFMKLRMQLDKTSPSQWKAVKNIISHLLLTSTSADGKVHGLSVIKNVYRGVGPNLVGSTAAWALYFSFYREYKDLILKYTDSTFNDSNLNSAEYLLSAFGAGWTTSILTNPIWVIKTRMIATSRQAPGAYTSIIDGIKQIYRYEGFVGYYKGLSPALLNVSQGALQFSIYDTFKHHFILRKGSPERKLTTFEYLYSSAISKITATMTLYPLQVIRSRLQVNNGLRTISARQLVYKIAKEEGLKGFYKGLLANIIRVVPATCITFTVYEETRASLTL